MLLCGPIPQGSLMDQFCDESPLFYCGITKTEAYLLSQREHLAAGMRRAQTNLLQR
jgi:hypothetical protein